MQIPSYLTGAIYARAAKALRETVTARLSRHDLTPTAWTLLGAVAEAPNGIRLIELAHHLGVKAPFVTALANELTTRGLIDRVQHQFDRRAKLLVLTPKGKRLINTVEGEVEAGLQTLLAGLEESDLQAYQKVLETIIRNAGQLEP